MGNVMVIPARRQVGSTVKQISSEKATCCSLLPRQYGFRGTGNKLRGSGYTLHRVQSKDS